MIEEHQRRLESQANSISSNAAVAHFTKHRLQSRWKPRVIAKNDLKRRDSAARDTGRRKEASASTWARTRAPGKRPSSAVRDKADLSQWLKTRRQCSLSRISSEAAPTYGNVRVWHCANTVFVQDTSYWIGLSLDKETDRLNWVDNTTISENSFQNWYENLQPTVATFDL